MMVNVYFLLHNEKCNVKINDFFRRWTISLESITFLYSGYFRYNLFWKSAKQCHVVYLSSSIFVTEYSNFALNIFWSNTQIKYKLVFLVPMALKLCFRLVHLLFIDLGSGAFALHLGSYYWFQPCGIGTIFRRYLLNGLSNTDNISPQEISTYNLFFPP